MNAKENSGPIANEALEPFIVTQISAIESNCAAMRGILEDSGWELHNLRSFEEARRWRASDHGGVVITDAVLPDGNWKDILELLIESSHPSNLIVSSRLADDRLWAEVLNLGAFDLLAIPYRAEEVLHVVRSACRGWNWGCARSAVPSKPPLPAVYSRPGPRRVRAAGA